MQIIKCTRGTIEQFIDSVENRIEELKHNDVESSFIYPDDLEDLENGEYESHVTEPVNANAVVRPVTFGDFGVYVTDGNNKAELVFEGTEDECYEWLSKNNTMNSSLGFNGEEFYMHPNDIEECNEIYSSEIWLDDIYPTKTEMIDWLFEHEQAYSDALEFFKTDSLDNGVSYDDLLDWIYDHNMLANDMEKHFGIIRDDLEDDGDIIE